MPNISCSDMKDTTPKPTAPIPMVFASNVTLGLGVLTAFIGIIKLHGLLFPAPEMREYLRLSNPIFFFLSNRIVLFAAALTEIGVGSFALRSSHYSLRTRSGLLVWACVIALAYKLGLAVVHYKGPCGCLLGLNRFLPLTIGHQKALADVILISTLVLSLFAFGLTLLKRYQPKLAGATQS